MRNALVSLIAALAVSTPAIAQDEAGTTTVETTTTVTTTTTEAPPAAVATPIAAPPAAPAVPTDPATIRTLQVLDSVCKPLVDGGDYLALTKAVGFKKKRDVQTLQFAKPGVITVAPPGSNKNVCLIEIDHAVGSDKALTVGVHDWAVARGYTLYRNDEFTTDLKRHTRSWELTRPDGKTEALVLITSRKADGSPLARNADKSTLMYSVR